MSQSVLASFDPLAVHPFTNTSGLMPKPAAPSQYPHLLPSPATLATPPPPMSTATPGGFVHSPKPSRAMSPKKNGSGKGPVFVPFCPDRSSPDLDEILLKKQVSDVLANKQPWCIDQASVPITATARRS